MNLLLIENGLDEVINYLNSNTDYVVFNNSQTYDQLLLEIDNKNSNYSTVGIFSHGNLDHFIFTEPVFSTSENTDFVQFMKSLSNKTQFSTLDIFACNFGQNSQFINDLENELGVNVRASTDNTGNTPFGDWVMETDQQDIKDQYFTSTITEFKQVLILKEHMNYNYKNTFTNEIKNSEDAKNQVYSNQYAFAALKSDGSVSLWGEPSYGGSGPSSVTTPNQSNPIVKVYTNSSGFTALRQDGTVEGWGNGGSPHPDVMNGGGFVVDKIYTNYYAFAALLNDGTVRVWGYDLRFGGDQTQVTALSLHTSNPVVKIYSTRYAFAALLNDGTVRVWGSTTYGGDQSQVNNLSLNDTSNPVDKIYSTISAFAALLKDGTVRVWGDTSFGGLQTQVNNNLGLYTASSNPVVKIYSAEHAFAALLKDGTVRVWGLETHGGDQNHVTALGLHTASSNPVVKIYSTTGAFAALKKDGTVSVWGDTTNGGNQNHVTALNLHIASSNPVVKIYSNYYGTFAALKKDGTVSVWGSNVGQNGHHTLGSSHFAGQYEPVVQIFTTRVVGKFGFILNNGNVIYDQTHQITLGNPFIGIDMTDTYVSKLNYEIENFDVISASVVPPASSNGDPYVTTLCGNKFKLPNSIRTYRMIEQSVNDKDLIVNASVSMLSKEEVDRLKLTASLYTKQEPVTDGYFYEKFFVSYGGKYAVFDRNINLIETNITSEIMKELNISIEYSKESRPFSCPIQGNSTSSDTVIRVSDSVITLKSIDHPQIINGIEFYTSKKTDTVSGILNTYLHPRNYVIKKVNSTKKIKNKVNTGYSKIVPEKWITVGDRLI